MFATRFKHVCWAWSCGLAVCVVAAVLCQTSTGLAQNSRDRYEGPAGGFYRPVPPWPPEMFFSYDHASTPLEGALRGWAALTHANGNYLISASQAAILNEQARWLALDNRQRWIEYRIGLRLWREFERQARNAKERGENEASRLTKYGVYQLDSEQLDRTTGRIVWPELLQAAAYDDLRQRLDQLFRQHASYGGTADDSQFQIQECVDDLQRNLRRIRSHVDRNEYLAAQKFLLGLKYEPKLERG